MDRFDDMAVFVAVVEAGSFTAAADRLGIAKSAVSRRIASLEARLGAELLRRTTRRQSLTETGIAFYQRAVRILADVDEAESAVAEGHGQLAGRLKIALPLSFGIRHMSAPLAEFARRHPQLEFDLDLNDRRVDLVEEGVDLALRIGHLRDSSLIARRLFDARTVVCASPSYLDKNGRPAHPDELQDHSCLVYSNLPEPGRWAYTDDAGQRRSVSVGGGIRASSGDFLCASAAAGLGIAMQPTFIAHEFIGRGDLEPILTGFGWPVTPAYAVYPPTRHLSHRVRRFIDFIAAWFPGTAPWDADWPERTPDGR